MKTRKQYLIISNLARDYTAYKVLPDNNEYLLSMRINTRKIFFPAYFLLGWLAFTILTFVFGPYEYEIVKPTIFYLYLTAILLSIYFGYKRGQKSGGRGLRNKISYYKFVKIAIIISLAYSIITLVATSGGNLGNISTTFSDSSQSYLTSSVRTGSTLFSYLNMFIYPITLIAITNAIFCFKKLSRRYRYGAYMLILISIASSIGAATRSGIVQSIILIIAAFSLGVFKKNIILKYHHKIKIFILGLLLLIMYLGYSFILTTTRGGTIISNNPITQEPPKEDFFLDKITPPEYRPLTYNISFYLSHSYYRLNQAMNLPFKGVGLGLSNSYFIMDNIESFTGWSGLKDISYGLRLDKETDDGRYGLYWSTFYTWIASDFTWPGTLVVMYLLGYFLSLSMKDSLFSQNPLSVTVFCVLFYTIFHSVFNNPMQDGQGIMTTLVLPMIWLTLRKKSYVTN